jgi:hypothetical protein
LNALQIITLAQRIRKFHTTAEKVAGKWPEDYERKTENHVAENHP